MLDSGTAPPTQNIDIRGSFGCHGTGFYDFISGRGSRCGGTGGSGSGFDECVLRERRDG